MRPTTLAPHDKLLIQQTVAWVRTVNESRPAGAPPVYPRVEDAESSALFRRLRQGLPPLPWAPPARHRQPAYELIENARGRHRVQPDGPPADGVWLLDGAPWRVLAMHEDGGAWLAFGHWPMAYRLTPQRVPRWAGVPANGGEGADSEVLRLPDGRLVTRGQVRREPDAVDLQWQMSCDSPLDERLYLQGERQPLDVPDHYQPCEAIGADGAIACRPFGHDTVLLPLVVDPRTGVRRCLALPAGQFDAPRRSRWNNGEAASAVWALPAWSLLELDARGTPLSAWRTSRASALSPLPAPA